MAKRVPPDAEESSEQSLRAGHWSRCEAALVGSSITVAASDMEGRYSWVFNPPQEFPGELVGRLDADVLDQTAAHTLGTAKAAALATGETKQVEIQLSGERGQRWFTVNVRPHFEAGHIVGSVASFIDITDSKVQEEHLRIVLRELAHRSKNLLAVIQGIARQTAESVTSTDQFISRFNGRVFSLSRAHDVLTDADWRGARVFDLVKSQIALYAEERLASVMMDGDNAFLRPNAAQYVGLALHELTTNALKYGALSRADGVVSVRFERDVDTALHRFTWRETSSAPIREPNGRSFGVLMLTEVVPISVSGRAELSFAPEGLRYVLDLPAAQLLP